MAKQKQKLELTWIGKENRPKLEPRVLQEVPEYSYHASHRVSEDDQFDNMLIHGDNLLALKALEQGYAGKVKCVYIDPPYNTGSAFEHYDDGIEHSLWLSLVRERLVILWNLLDPINGSLWISIDDREMPYLRILMDEICGRASFVASNVWQKRYSRENREAIGDVHEYIIVYARDRENFKKIRNKVPITEEQAKIYKNPNKDPRGRWRGIPMTAQGFRPNQMYEITTPSGVVHTPPEGRCWSTVESEFLKLKEEGRIWFGKDGKSQPNIIRYLSEVQGMTPWTWWPSTEVGHTDESKKEIHGIFGKKDAFDTPKPERLVERIVHIATDPGDLVLDSFLGSGTTAAVAHKMGRRWIGVELGDHCETHCLSRLKKVVDGDDPGGITKAVNWQGGGGFRYLKLAESLIKEDSWGNPVINPNFNPELLAEAVCKVEGYRYAPSAEHYWMHGQATETAYIYVTTQSLSRAQLEVISQEVGPERSLLICCGAFRVQKDAFENLILKKIPQEVLDRCEWNHDDYSLRVENLPDKPKPKGQQEFSLEGGEDA